MDRKTLRRSPSPRTMNVNRRRIVLVNPRLQMRILLLLLASVGSAVCLQALLTARSLSDLALRVPNDGQFLLDETVGIVVRGTVLSVLVLLPMFGLLTVVGTFRLFGPLYRFERFLEGVADGTHPQACRIREGDELQELCDLLNEVTRDTRERIRRDLGEPESMSEPDSLVTEDAESPAAAA